MGWLLVGKKSLDEELVLRLLRSGAGQIEAVGAKERDRRRTHGDCTGDSGLRPFLIEAPILPKT